jgi:hypothetical protein
MLQYLFLIRAVSVLIIKVFFGFKMHTDVFHFFLKVNAIYRQLISIWIRALLGPMHVGLMTGPLCSMFCTKLKEPCSFTKVPDDPYT